MERVHINLTAKQLAWLDDQSEKTGLSRSDLLRRILDAAIKEASQT